MTAWKQAQHCKTCYGVSLFDQDSDQLYYVGTLKKLFSKLLSKKEHQDVLLFHWFDNRDIGELISLRFKRLEFGLIQSPFILNATIDQHLEIHKEQHPILKEEVKKDIYVHDLITGAEAEANKSTHSNIQKFQIQFTLVA